MLTLIAALAMTQSAVDHGVLIGLRDPKGGYRTVLVSQRGVAFVSKEHKGELLRPMKMSVHAFRTEEQGLLYQGNHQAVPGTFRIAWAGGTGIGLEFDASRPGERPFSRKYRRVLGNENFRKFSDALDVHEKSAFADAAARS